MKTETETAISIREDLALLSTRGLTPKDNPLAILELTDTDDQPPWAIQAKARAAMSARCSHWTPTAALRWDALQLADYRRATHAFLLLDEHGRDIIDACQNGGGITRFIEETPYPDQDLDWARLFAKSLIIRAEEDRAEHPALTQELIGLQVHACQSLGDSLWGYRLQGIEPFELGEMLQELLALPEVAIKGYPSDLTAFAIRWRFSKWASKGATTYATIRAVSAKQRSTWEAGPPPLFEITINGPAWLVMTEVERMFVLHHELQHGLVDVFDREAIDPTLGWKPSTVGHDAEVMGATWARFGAFDFDEAYAVRAAWNNPRTQELLQLADEMAVADPFDLDRVQVLADEAADGGGTGVDDDPFGLGD